MDPNRSPWALGAAFLGLVLCCLAVLLRFQAARGSDTPLPFPTAQSLAEPQVAVSLGWPLHATECDPRIWSRLPGIGPVLSRRLAGLAEAGELRYPSDLLRVRGIGPKMATRLEPWIEWPSDSERSLLGPGLPCRRGTDQ